MEPLQIIYYRAKQDGSIYRDERGAYKGAVQAMGMKIQSPLESELQAILMAIQHSWILGYSKIVLESECQKSYRYSEEREVTFWNV